MVIRVKEKELNEEKSERGRENEREEKKKAALGKKIA